MVVKELKNGNTYATVTLSYEEIRDLANLLFDANTKAQEQGSDKFEELDLEFNVLQELTKGGGLQLLVTRYNIKRLSGEEEKQNEKT